MSLIDYEFIALIIALIVAILSTIMRIGSTRREREEAEERADERFGELSDLLKRAGSKIRQMEDEIESKSKKVKELDRMRKELDGLVSLRDEQMTAIRSELKSVLDASARRNRIWTIILGAIWFIIGLFVRGFLGF